MPTPRSQHDGLREEGDRYLVDRIRHGDGEAFTQLVDRFSGRLVAYAARRVSGTGIDAEDVVQETFLGLLQSLDRLGRIRTLQAYLFQILRHKIFDLTHRRPEAHGLRPIPLATKDSSSGARGYEPVAAVGTPSSYAQHDEALEVRNRILADILEETISGLREQRNFRDLKILELLFYGSWKNRDIAGEVGTSEPTVTRVKNAALEKLARLAARHPDMNDQLDFASVQDESSHLIRNIWSENLLSCLKRSTLGTYALGALGSDWVGYVKFHLEIVKCEYCAANLADLKKEVEPMPQKARERLFVSSVGFLRKLGGK